MKKSIVLNCKVRSVVQQVLMRTSPGNAALAEPEKTKTTVAAQITGYSESDAGHLAAGSLDGSVMLDIENFTALGLEAGKRYYISIFEETPHVDVAKALTDLADGYR